MNLTEKQMDESLDNLRRDNDGLRELLREFRRDGPVNLYDYIWGRKWLEALGEKERYCISGGDYESFGCPVCGFNPNIGIVEIKDACKRWETTSSHGRCSDCGTGFVLLADGATKSFIGFGGEGKESVYPELQGHPRYGIKGHGVKDKTPDNNYPEGSEFFGSRGLGLDGGLKCFCCNSETIDSEGHKYLNNISGFVRSREAGERVEAMFEGTAARLDFRKFEPTWIQVKIGACDEHKNNLETLHRLTELAGGVIHRDMINIAKQVTNEK